MDFYSDLSQHFEDIFPLREPKLKAVQKYVEPGGQVLDIGCSTGELVIALAKEGYLASGTDLNQEMIQKARKLAETAGVQADFQVGDMRQLREMYQAPFDGISCFGNTIVHLQSVAEIRDLFRQVFELLRAGGTFVFQIINYDRVLHQDVQGLPTIRNEEKGLNFYRDYEYDREAHLVHFKTRLVSDGGETKEHSIPLYPLQSQEIEKLLLEVGFGEIEFFGNMKMEAFDPASSRPLVVVAHKE